MASTADNIKAEQERLASEKTGSDPVARALENCEVCGSGRKAVVYCVKCESRFCAICDKNHHTGALAKHKLVPYIVQTGKTTDKRMPIAVSDEVSKELGNNDPYDVVARNKRLLSEQLYLLKHKVGSGANFLRHKLTKQLDTQLRALVNGRLKEDFDEMHKYLDDRELKIATDIFNWRKVFFPQILTQVTAVEQEVVKDLELIKKAEYTLNQSNAYFLESTNVQKLLAQMGAAVKRDTVAKTKALENHINLSEHRAFRLDSVKRAVDRIFIGRAEDNVVDTKSIFASPVQRYVEVDFDQLQFAAAAALSWKKVAYQWNKKWGNKASINTDDQLRITVKLLGDQLLEDHPVPEEYVNALFSQYERTPHLQKLRDEVLDVVLQVFDSVSSDSAALCESIRERLDPEKGNDISMPTLAATWALYLEKHLERGIIAMINERRIRPRALTIAADQELVDPDAEDDDPTPLTEDAQLLDRD